MNWTREHAIDMWSALTPAFKSAGYILTIYGSALNGRGRDLDLIAVAWRPSPWPADMLESEICKRFKLTPVGSPEHGLMKTDSRLYRTAYEQLIDLQIRKAECTMEEAFEYSMRAM